MADTSSASHSQPQKNLFAHQFQNATAAASSSSESKRDESATTTKTPSGVVLDKDGKPCVLPTTTAFDPSSHINESGLTFLKYQMSNLHIRRRVEKPYQTSQSHPLINTSINPPTTKRMPSRRRRTRALNLDPPS
jgi:hypothetical protein